MGKQAPPNRHGKPHEQVLLPFLFHTPNELVFANGITSLCELLGYAIAFQTTAF